MSSPPVPPPGFKVRTSPTISKPQSAKKKAKPAAKALQVRTNEVVVAVPEISSGTLAVVPDEPTLLPLQTLTNTESLAAARPAETDGTMLPGIFRLTSVGLGKTLISTSDEQVRLASDDGEGTESSKQWTLIAAEGAKSTFYIVGRSQFLDTHGGDCWLWGDGKNYGSYPSERRSVEKLA